MSDNKPKIFGFATYAIVGSNKIIFCNMFSSGSYTGEFVVLTYDQPFTIEIGPYRRHQNIRRAKWFNDFTYTYRWSQSNNYYLLRVEQTGKKKSICKYIDSATDYQFGDYSHDTIFLSNGDILFNNLGDVTSSVLFSKNSPKITCHKWVNDVYPDNIEHEEFLFNLINKFNPKQLKNIIFSDVINPNLYHPDWLYDQFRNFIDDNLYNTNIIDEYFNEISLKYFKNILIRDNFILCPQKYSNSR